MLDWHLGVSPIQEELPAGSNPRDGETFALLEAEINKRLDLHSQAATDWQLVSKLATTILREEGKDLSVATWLLLGWAHCYDAAGLAAGVRVLHDVHAHHWEAMTPPVTRLRGRRNQMEWLLQELEATLIKRMENWTALEPQEHAELLRDWNALDALWQEVDDQAPALFKLQRMLMELAPVSADEAEGMPEGADVTPAVSSDGSASATTPAAEPSAASAGAGGADVSKTGDDDSHGAKASALPESSAGSGGTDAPVGTKQKSGTSATTSQRTAAQTGSGSESSVMQTGNEAVPGSADAVERLIDQGFETMQAVLRDLPDELVLMPVLYRLNRVRAWLTLDALPPATEGESRIPAPPPADQDGLQRLIDAQDALSVLRFAESRLVSHRFWLDLNRIAYEAAQALPDGQPVADVIATESLSLILRLPGLQDLSFTNGQPFADAATHAWLASLGGAPSAPPVPSGRVDSVALPVSAGTLGMATLLAAAGAETQAAARLLDVVAARLQSGSDQILQRQ